jgi:hypothetical protein
MFSKTLVMLNQYLQFHLFIVSKKIIHLFIKTEQYFGTNMAEERFTDDREGADGERRRTEKRDGGELQ